MTAAPTTPVTWDRDPACSATAVRDPLVLTGKPWKKPGGDVRGADADHLLVAPHPLAPTGRERRRRRHRVGQRDDRDGHGAEEQRGQVAHADSGNVKRREALRQHADRLDPVGLQVEQVDREGGEHHHDEHPRDLGQQPIQQQDADQRGDADHRGRGVGLPCASPDTKACASAMRPSASTENPNSLGSWPTMIVSASPFM